MDIPSGPQWRSAFALVCRLFRNRCRNGWPIIQTALRQVFPLPRFSVSEADYLEHIRQIHEAIAAATPIKSVTPRVCTCKLTAIRFNFTAACASLCRMPFCLVCPTGQGRKRGLCVSPELFLKIDSDGLITTEPMKGTAPILYDGQDERRAVELQNDPKTAPKM